MPIPSVLSGAGVSHPDVTLPPKYLFGDGAEKDAEKPSRSPVAVLGDGNLLRHKSSVFSKKMVSSPTHSGLHHVLSYDGFLV